MLIHKGCGGEVEEDTSLRPYRYDSNEGGNETEIYPHICQECGKEILGDAQVEIVEDKCEFYPGPDDDCVCAAGSDISGSFVCTRVYSKKCQWANEIRKGR